MAEPTRGALGLIMTVVGTGAVLARVALIVALAMVLFLLAFLGYFVLPFIFVLLALGILGVSSTLREMAGFQARRRK